MSSGKRDKWIKWVVLIVVLAGGGFGGYKYYKIQKHKANKVHYRPEVVTRGDIDHTVLSTGEVLPQNRLEIKAPIAGRIEQILIKEGDKVKQGQIMAWMSSTERAALLDSARAKGEAEVKRWEDMYKPTPILAPINGTVILRNVEQGQSFTSADAVFVLSDRLIVKAKVDETDLAQIKLKQRATIILDAYSTEPVEGRVDKLAFEAVTTNNVTTYTTDVAPITTPDFMRSGMTANVTFFAESHKNVILIPTEAIDSANGKTFVMVPSGGEGDDEGDSEEGKGEGHKGSDKHKGPVQQPVTLGLSDGKRTEITEGLKEGQTILIKDLTLNAADKTANPFMPFGNKRPPGTGSRQGGGPPGGGGGR